MNYTQEELEVLEAIENGEYSSVPNLEEEKKRYSKIFRQNSEARNRRVKSPQSHLEPAPILATPEIA